MKDLSNKNVIHIYKDGVEYIQFRRLLKYPEINHCYTLRKHNLNFKTNEDEQVLQESYCKIANALKVKKDNIVKPHQTHTDKVEIITENTPILDEVDGMITNKKNVILCTTSADCTSLLFYDPIKKVIGDVHSGWRGTVQRIGQKAVKKMIQEYDCHPEDIICCICPHIRKCHFEVEEDVVKLFQREFSAMKEFDGIIEKEQIVNGVQKYHIDTTKINIEMLKEIGLVENNIIDSELCTVCEAESFHSYRVDRELTGRNVAMITFK